MPTWLFASCFTFWDTRDGRRRLCGLIQNIAEATGRQIWDLSVTTIEYIVWHDIWGGTIARLWQFLPLRICRNVLGVRSVLFRTYIYSACCIIFSHVTLQMLSHVMTLNYQTVWKVNWAVARRQKNKDKNLPQVPLTWSLLSAQPVFCQLLHLNCHC